MDRHHDAQDILVFDSTSFGRVMVLDGVIQSTERDEFSYQEMIVNLPLCALDEPAKRVLVVGGGDGGVLRELCRHSNLEKVDIAEIDEGVIKASKEFLPHMAKGFLDPRVCVHIGDGLQFVKDAPEDHYDAIIVDSSDPVGPAAVLFEKPFYESMHRALRPGGIICTQGESVWLHLDIIKEVTSMCRGIFQGGAVSYAYTTIPTYPSGQIGFVLSTKARDGAPLQPNEPRQPAPPMDLSSGPLRYYTSDLHRAAFVLPAFAAKVLSEAAE